MLFNSIEFLVFFPVVVGIYFMLPHKYRWIFQLVASYYFYMCWKAEYIVLIMGSTVIDYVSAIQIEKAQTKARKNAFLVLSLVTNLGILFAFKYFNFFNESIRFTLDQFNIFYDVPEFQVLLPVGISFYTFQTLSYTIDVYKGNLKPERHFGIFALYVSFWPQLVAGPIERATHLLPQFYNKVKFEYQRVSDGLKLMLWGFFKKIVIADRLAEYVNTVYNNPDDHHGWSVIIATVFFGFQIYCDFSGYSDIAIGAARVMGFDLMTNFLRPYFSKNVSEFWRRWHISLSTWFRDYFYIPLGGNRVAVPRWFFNLFMTFLISGLWHGANWTFVAWGALHGFYLVFAIVTKNVRAKVNTAIGLKDGKWYTNLWQVLVTFVLVHIAWVFFRANSIGDAFSLIGNAFDFGSSGNVVLIDSFQFALAWVAIAVLIIIDWWQRRYKDIAGILNQQPIIIRWGIYYFLLLSIIVFGVFGEQAFIYFQF